MKNIFKITFLVFTVFCLFYFILPVQAQTLGNEELINFGEAAGYGEAPLPQVIGNIVKIGLSLLGLIAVIIMIAGGFIWMTSGGVADKVTKAKKIISSGLIGLLIIVFAYAIVSFIMGRLSGVTGEGLGGSGGCTPGLCCGPGLRCDSGGSCNISDPDCSLPPDAFRIRKIETTHGGLEQNYHQDVYLCSAVQPIFNHSVDGLIIEDLETAGDLRIETGASPVSGSWQTRNNIIIFKHPDLFDPNTSYEAYFPKAISDTQGEFLQVCLAAGDCLDAGSYFLWNFMTGETLDTVPPEIVATYPIFDQSDPDYPDQNVSRKPSIEASFSEPIDMTTVADENNYPIETNIWLARLDGQGGTIVETLAKEIFEIGAISNGFRISLRDENLLQAFTWYRIHVGNIEDLCMNQMDEPLEWEFQTNDQAPGISFWHPTGTLVCPDTDISVTFGTQMYGNLVRFEISGGGDNFDFEMRPSEFDPPYEEIVIGGVFRVDDPGDPVNNHFRVFTFDPDDNLQTESDYQVTVLTDLVIDQQGTLLSDFWEFTTATMGNCFCSPWISHLEPAQGSKGECITLHGSCFEGTATQPALPIKIDFILNGTPTQTAIEGSDNNYLTTQVPDIYSQGDRPEVQATIEYDGGDQLTSNLVEFYVDSNEQANGPCLFSINPSAGYSNETEVDLSGIRFGVESAGSKVVFYNNKLAVYQTWSDQQISSALVPLGSEDGLVYVENDQGMSNELPFDILQHPGGPGQACQEATFCPDNPPYNCSTPIYNCLYEATDTCRCCCDVITNSCEAPLECMANQGSCTGDDRGLCCGCESDDQCGNGLGCGFLDPNQCCYAQPTITSNSPTGEAVCLNTAIEANFSQDMDRNSLNTNNIKLKKLPPLIESKLGIDYTTTQYTSCLDQSGIYTGRCDVNWWDYSFNVSADGDYQIYVETSNYSADVKDFGEDGVCSEPGVQHHVKVFVDNVEKGDFCADATLGHQISNVSLGNITAGTHTIRLEWDNDWSESPHDSNIRIYQVDLRQESSEQDVSYNLIINEDNDQVNLLPIDCDLDPYTGYKVELIGGLDGQGIRDSLGVSMDDYTWQFATGPEDNICEISEIIVSPDSAIVESFEDSVIYTAQGYNFNNNPICVAEFFWQSDDINIAVVSPSQALETTVSPVEGEGEQTTDISATISGYSGSGEFTSVLSPPVLPPEDPETFDLPQVFEDSTCLNNIQTPSPRHLSSQACRNALISARFNMEVDNLSNTNIIVEKCNLGNEMFDSASCTTDVSGTIVETDKSFVNPQHNAVHLYPDITTANRFCFEHGYTSFKATYSTVGPIDDYMRYVDGEWVEESSAERIDTLLCSKGFIYTPGVLLDQNHWYQVTLKSGETGIVDSVDNYQLDGNKDGIEDDSPNDDYTWYFKTKDQAEVCSAQAIEIFEQDPVGIIIESGTKDYSALPIGPDCQILRPDTFTWTWESTEPGVATVAPQTPTYTAMATAVDLGETEIEVTATPSAGEPVTNSVDLVVAIYPNVETFQPSGSNVCRNSVIKAIFDQPMDRSSISKDTIKFFKWTTLWDDITSTVDVSAVDDIFREPTNDIPNPQHGSYYLYPSSATAQQYCLDQDYRGFDSYTTTLTLGSYMRYNNGAWGVTGHGSYIATLTCYNENKTIVNINAGLLDSNQEYQITILGGENGVESIYGVGMAADYNSTFTTSDQICTLSEVDIEPKTIDFTSTDESENLIAYTYDNQGNEILGIPDVYDWTWSWESSDPAVVSITGSSSEDETAMAQDRNGRVQITATATIVGSDPAISVLGITEANVLICEVPWTFEDAAGPGFAPNTQFKLSYCRGDLAQAEADRLPELAEASIEGSDPLIKEFLFSVGDSGDVIGLKVFNNPKRLSVLNWYEQNVPNPGKPSNFVIDNYYALREGRTTYVGATNLGSDTDNFSNPQHGSYYLYPDNATAQQYCVDDQNYSGFESYTTTGSGGGYMRYNNGAWGVTGHGSYIATLTCADQGVYTYVYLISYNDGASPKTIEIFNQILYNWEFNINLDNYFEDKPKLQNDLLRLYNFQEIKDELEEHYQEQGEYPTLGAGTYVLSKSNSLWPSWTNTLSQALGESLPVDPINEFNGPCAGCIDEPDSQCDNTCYNPSTQIFEIPDGSHVYQYYAPDQSGCLGEYYTLSVNLEYGNGGIIWKGEEDVITTQSDSSGDFNYIYESPGAPVCGDGTLQCGEQCDCGSGYGTCCSPFQSGYCPGTTFPSEGFIPAATCEGLGYESEPTGFLECNNCSWSGVSCALKANGEACSGDANCHSGSCVDGVCCDMSCTGSCEYCGEGFGGSAGTCHNVSAGNDPRNICNDTSGCLTGNCDGSGFCTDYYTSGDRNCSACQTCDGAGSGTCVNKTNNTQDTVGSTLCQDTCKRCYNGSCVNQTAGQDPFNQCEIGWISCDSDCVRGGGSGLCGSSGSCDPSGGTENIPSGSVCTGAGEITSVSASNYCGSPENNCSNNSCSGTRWYRSCNGSGACRGVGDYTGGHLQPIMAQANCVLYPDCTLAYRSTSNYCGAIVDDCTNGACVGYRYYRGCDGSGACKADATGSYQQTVYPNTGKTLTGSCSPNGTTLCDFSSWNYCNTDCFKTRDELRCSAGHACSYDVGNNGSIVAENKVCVNGSEISVSSTYYCDIDNSCTSGACSGTIYYRSCAYNGVCKTDNSGAFGVTINADAGNILTASCGQSTAQCTTCYQCDGTGDCDPVTDTGPPPYLGCDTGTCCAGVCCPTGEVCNNGACVPPCDCTTGACCDGCYYRSSEYVCRPADSECDISETCTGSSSSCPADQSVSDGTECMEACGECQSGICDLPPKNACTPGEGDYVGAGQCRYCEDDCQWGPSEDGCPTDSTYCSDCVATCGSSCDDDQFCCGDEAGCFIAGTLITTENGFKNIEDIKVGDIINGYDLEKNRIQKVKVMQTFEHEKQDYYIMTLLDYSVLKVTNIHPIYTRKGYLKVKDLNIWDEVGKINNNGRLEFVKIIKIKKAIDQQTVYNLEVDKLHNYFANDFLVHNKDYYCGPGSGLKRNCGDLDQ